MNADSPPVVPVVEDAYLRWDQWPVQRIGVRAQLRSTYDRTGGNRTADASHFLYQAAEDFNVTLDVEGAGVLYFVRTNHWHGSPWHYEIDSVDHIVAESTTPDPTRKLDAAIFVPAALFPAPLAVTYATTHGADLNWVPMAFARGLRLAYSRTFYGTGYYIYHQFVPGLPLSRALSPWDGRTAPDPRVLALLANSGSDQAPTDGALSHEGSFALRADSTLVLCELRNAPAMIRYFELSVPVARAVEFGAARLKITWDDRAFASVDAPLDLFFGAGTLHNSDAREWLVKALPMAIRFQSDRVVLSCQFPMPYFRATKIELVAAHTGAVIDGGRWSLRCVPYTGPWNHVGYFHATFLDHGVPRFGEDLTFLDTRGIEGAHDWSGSLVGTSFVFTDANVLTTLEGDPRFFFDDSGTPQAQGTGTEEWGGGGDYWGGRTMTLPLAGHPVGVVDKALAKDPRDLIHSAYRFLLADLMPFGQRAQIRFEHGGENESIEHYRSVVHWYGLPSPSLVLTDTLRIGDASSERAHRYHSPQASDPYEIVSRYEWGPDHLPLAYVHPLAEPSQCVDYAFDAPRGRYHLWLELACGAELFDTAVWIQVNDDIGGVEVCEAYMGAGGIRNFGRPAGTYRFQTGVAPASVVELHRDGPQRLRIQPRTGRVAIGRVLLGPARTVRPAADAEAGPNEILLNHDDINALTGSFEVRADSRAHGGIAVVAREPPDEIELFPSESMQGRRTTGASEFTFALRPDNHGVILRRTLDYAFAHQRAIVSIQTEHGWADAGVWFLAGSNTVYHSFPFFDGELGASAPTVITSNRRFRDDEFLLPLELTRGRGEIRVRVEFAPRNPPLLPSRAPEPSAWTELVYRVYCVVMPRVELA